METKKTKVQFSLKDIKRMAHEVEAGSELLNLPKDVVESVNLTVEANKYLKEKLPSKYISERLRTNTVGAFVVDSKTGVKSIATTRGRPRGTLAAISDGENVYIGVAYPSNTEKFVVPQIGTYLALKMAFKNLEEKNSTIDFVKGADLRQATHFYKRAQAYFMPDKYSFSRGKTPVDYFDAELHKRQEMLGFKNK